jgi:hypothetical protein
MMRRWVAAAGWILAASIEVGAWAATPEAADSIQQRRDYGVQLALGGNPALAETVFEALLSLDDPCAWTGLANLHAMRGEFSSALVFYRRAQRTDSSDAGIVLDRAIVLHLMGQEEPARVEAARGVRLAGTAARAESLLALQSESGKAVEFSRVFEIPIPKKRPVRLSSWNVRELLTPRDSTAMRLKSTAATRSSAEQETRSASQQPASSALLFYWKR